MLFIFGEVTDTPGDTNPFLVVVGCLVAIAALLYLVFRNVQFLRPLFIGLSSVSVVLSLSTLLFSGWWENFRNSAGPALAVATLILSFALAFWARREPRTAGLLIVLVTLAPLIVETIIVGEIHLGGSTGALSLPGIIAGTLITLGSLGASR